jgi:DNA-binding SARP family transcriptional activator
MNPTRSQAKAALRIQTLGGFRVWRAGRELRPADWGREKALHLFQFLVTARRRPLHKEQIVERLWPQLDSTQGDRDFKVALNALNRALEPKRPPRKAPRFVRRYELAYALDGAETWVDADAFEAHVTAGNRAFARDAASAVEHYRAAVEQYAGDYLPERQYEDWSSVERERLLLLALGTMTSLANLLVEESPLESLRLTQTVIARDPAWEDAYRIQMRAYLHQGNRAQALRTYERCVQALASEFGVKPLPETLALYRQLLS